MQPMPLIRNIDELTADLMTEIMRSNGNIGQEVSVIDMGTEAFGDKDGLLSFMYRLTLTYSEADAGPASVVVKLPTDDPNQRGIADALGFFNRECVFYRDIAEKAPFDTPSVYSMAQDDESTDFVIIMEDLGHMDRIDQVVGASLEQSEIALSALARFHAYYWENDQLDELSEIFLPLDNPIYHAALPDVFAGGWAALKANAPDLVRPEIVDFADNFAAHLGTMLGRLNTPRTIIHGDYRSDNLMLDTEGNLSVIDFQIASTGNHAFDIAYFLSSSVTEETRRDHSEHLLRMYHSILTESGVDRSYSDLVDDFRMGLNFCLIYGVASFAGWESFGDRQKDLMRAIGQRSIASIIDHDALALFGDLK